jgi:hypothetical protein
MNINRHVLPHRSDILRELTKTKDLKSSTPIQVLVTLTVGKFPEEGSPVPKLVGIDIHHEL